jgi:O-methyltransferase domain
MSRRSRAAIGRTSLSTVLDLATPAATAARALAAAGLADRGQAQTGSFFEPLPARAGGYLLSRVIHDWGDDDARRILAADAGLALGTVTPVGRRSILEFLPR